MIADKKKQNLLVALCCIAYFSSYMTRLNFAASILAIVEDLGVAKTALGMAVTGLSITYGVGQLLSGVMGDRIRPDRLMVAGLICSGVCNLMIPLLRSAGLMTLVWCVNGFAQAMLWPPMTRILAANLTPEKYKKACVAVSNSASVATILIYLIIPVILSVSSWRLVFVLSGLIALSVAVVWATQYGRVAQPVPVRQLRAQQRGGMKQALSYMVRMGALPILLIILLQGIMRDGVTTWMPSYIDEVYHLGASVSILSSAVLPVISILSVSASSWIHSRAGDEFRGAVTIWIIALACVLPLMFFYSSQAVLSVLLMSVLTGCRHGVNLMFISIYPSRFSDTPYMATIAGIVNAFTYVGASISNYGFAALSENYGWGVTIVFWAAVVLAGLLLSVYCARKHPKKAV